MPWTNTAITVIFYLATGAFLTTILFVSNRLDIFGMKRFQPRHFTKTLFIGSCFWLPLLANRICGKQWFAFCWWAYSKRSPNEFFQEVVSVLLIDGQKQSFFLPLDYEYAANYAARLANWWLVHVFMIILYLFANVFGPIYNFFLGDFSFSGNKRV